MTPAHPPVDLSGLNPEQRTAVLQTEGPVLVLAGAGSGKTRVIAHRVVHLLDKGVSPRAILAVTFTNKAAAEMKERIARIAGGGARIRGLTVSTFHAFGVRVVRERHQDLDLPPKFAIFDSGDQSALIKRLLRDIKVDDRSFDLGRIVSILSRRRTSGKGPAEFGVDEEYELLANELLPRYEAGLRAMGAVDFDDLLLLPLRLFRDKPEVLEAYQRRFRYLLVDEYQDTNDAQFALLELLAGVRRNLCVVGDDDQSIYAWRGAQVKNILEFDRKFPGTTEVFLEQNYRSVGGILEAANAVIGKNPDRKGKKLWTDRGRGKNIQLVCAQNDEAEAKHVADEILRLTFEDKIPLHEIAILARTNGQAKPFEEALRLAGIRYRVVGGTSLFDRKEVRDVLAYLRAALNPRDEVSLLRIINVPARGIGDQTVARAQQLARAEKRSVWEVLQTATARPELSHAAERIEAFVALLERFSGRLARKGFSGAARELVEEVQLFEEARKGAQSLPAQARRVEAIEGVLRQLVEFEKRAEQKAQERRLTEAAQAGLAAVAGDAPSAGPQLSSEGNALAAAALEAAGLSEAVMVPEALAADEEDEAFAAGLPGYLNRLALDSKDADGEGADAVTLMTLHGAKGLEWRAVFLVGLEEGLLPHSGKGFDDGTGGPEVEGVANLEEERRLCYVGITRARERLTLTRCAERVKRGKATPRTPSRFLEDLPVELLDVIDLSQKAPELAPEVKELKAKSFFAAMDALLGDPGPGSGKVPPPGSGR